MKKSNMISYYKEICPVESGHKNVMYTIYYENRLQVEVRKKETTTPYNNTILGLLQKTEISSLFLDIVLALKTTLCS